MNSNNYCTLSIRTSCRPTRNYKHLKSTSCFRTRSHSSDVDVDYDIIFIIWTWQSSNAVSINSTTQQVCTNPLATSMPSPAEWFVTAPTALGSPFLNPNDYVVLLRLQRAQGKPGEPEW